MQREAKCTSTPAPRHHVDVQSGLKACPLSQHCLGGPAGLGRSLAMERECAHCGCATWACMEAGPSLKVCPHSGSWPSALLPTLPASSGTLPTPRLSSHQACPSPGVERPGDATHLSPTKHVCKTPRSLHAGGRAERSALDPQAVCRAEAAARGEWTRAVFKGHVNSDGLTRRGSRTVTTVTRSCRRPACTP